MDKKPETKTEIKKIVLSVGKKEIILTYDEAKQMKTLLNELFGRDVIKEIRVEEKPVYKPWWYNQTYYTSPLSFTAGAVGIEYKPSNQTVYCSVTSQGGLNG